MLAKHSLPLNNFHGTQMARGFGPLKALVTQRICLQFNYFAGKQETDVSRWVQQQDEPMYQPKLSLLGSLYESPGIETKVHKSVC